MRIKRLIVGVLLCSLLMTTTVFAKTEPTYNTPNTTSSDTDKKSECEVTADIHYAYYVSMPASLSLEPADSTKHLKKMVSIPKPNSEFKSIMEETFDSDIAFICFYQVKARAKSSLGTKSIYIVPTFNFEDGLAYQTQPHSKWAFDNEESIQEYREAYNEIMQSPQSIIAWTIAYGEGIGMFSPCYLSGITNNRVMQCTILQDKRLFGNANTENTIKIDTTKWTALDGCVYYDYENDVTGCEWTDGKWHNHEGAYKGNFNFVYGLVDSID